MLSHRISHIVLAVGFMVANAAFAASPPLAPSDLSGVAISSTQINLSWTDNDPGENPYELQRSTDSTFVTYAAFPLTNDMTAYFDTAVIANTTYYYRVRALGLPMEPASDYSNAIAVTTPLDPGSGIPAPTGLFASAISGTQVSLSWMDNSMTESGYEVQRSNDPMFMFYTTIPLPANTMFYSDFSVAPNTIYHYRVRAKAVPPLLDSNFSNVASVTTPAGSTLPAPTGLIATALSASQVSLTWVDNSLTESGFDIQRSNDPMFMFYTTIPMPSNSTSYIDSTVAPSTTYYYRVRAHSNVGPPPPPPPSDFSNVATVTTLNNTLAAPSFLTAAALSGIQVQLSWLDNSFSESGFEIQRSSDPTFIFWTGLSTPSNVTSFIDFTVMPNTTYYYRVRASGSFGPFPTPPSDYSNTATVTTPTINPVINIQYPFPGAYIAAGSGSNVFVNAQYASGPLVVEFSSDSGASWSFLASYPVVFTTNGNQNYSIFVQYPPIIADTCRVRVTDQASGVVASMDGDFRLVIPFDVTHPKGGEVFYPGQSQTFEVRDIDFFLSSITVELSRDNGASWTELGSASGEERQYSGNIPFTWTVSGPPSKECKLRVTGDLGGVLLSTETNLFTISAVDLSQPVGGGAPAGPAGGDLTGTYPDPTIKPAAVTTEKIADGAVTAGPVPPFGVGGKISSSGMSPDRLLASDGSGGSLWKHLDDITFASSGLTAAQQFVKKQGDTMTGALTAPEVHVGQNGLNVGTQQLVTTNGRVGIGTATPTSKLTVAGAIETDNGVKFTSAGKQTAAVNGGIAPVTSTAKNHVETINDPNVKAGSVIVVSLLDGDSGTTNNRDATLTLRSVSNGSFTVSLTSANTFSTTQDRIHYIILVSP